MNWKRLLKGGMLGCLLAGQVLAEIPGLFNYQARLAGFDNEVVSLTVTIYDSPTGGTALFSEMQTAQLSNGIFAMKLGAASGGVPRSALDGAEAWVGLSVNGAPEFTERSRLVSVPFAYLAQGAEGLVLPDTTTPVVTVNASGEVDISDKIKLYESSEDAGRMEFRNEDALTTVTLNAAGLDTGGRLVLSNGDASDNVSTVRIDGDSDGAGQLYLYDENGIEAVRLHADRNNEASELSMFMGPQASQDRETVELVANSDGGDSNTGGRMVLRHVADAAETATKTIELRASSPSLLPEYNSGGKFEMSFTDGNPVFTVQAGTMGALFPLYMELKTPSDDGRRIRFTPTNILMYDLDGNNTVSIAGSGSTFTGEITVAALNITGGSDLSESFDVTSDGIAPQPGMVVCIDPENPGQLRLSEQPYDLTVAGVISGAGGVNVGMRMGQSGTIADGDYPVALTGRVWVQCDAGDAAIQPGDLLTTAGTTGHAMRATDRERANGAIIGKAMTKLPVGQRGLVLVLVNLQ